MLQLWNKYKQIIIAIISLIVVVVVILLLFINNRSAFSRKIYNFIKDDLELEETVSKKEYDRIQNQRIQDSIKYTEAIEALNKQLIDLETKKKENEVKRTYYYSRDFDSKFDIFSEVYTD